MQIGDIGTDYQQEKKRSSLHQVEVERRVLAVDVGQQCRHFYLPAQVCVGTIVRQVPSEGIQIGLCLARRYSLAQPAHHGKIVSGAIGKLRVRWRQRQVKVSRGRILHGLGHHADYVVGVLIQLDRAPNSIRIGLKMRFPESVAQHNHAVAARLRLTLVKDSALKGTGPHYAEEGGRNIHCRYLRSAVGPGQTHVRVTIRSQFLKRAALALPVSEVCQRDTLVIAMILLLVDNNHVLQIRDRQGTKDHRIHHAEAGRIGADANGQSEHSGDRETRRQPQLAHGVTQILEQVVHRNPPVLSMIWHESPTMESAFLLPNRTAGATLIANSLGLAGS